MESIEFIKKRLTELHGIFLDIQIRYEYRANTQSHIIEVIPYSFFEGNEEYMSYEYNMEDEFENTFPDENILFISDDSLTEINEPIFLAGYDALKFENPVIEDDEYIVEHDYYIVESAGKNTNYALAA